MKYVKLVMSFVKRQTIRRQLVDYSRPNYFFITICCFHNGYYFEKYPELLKIAKNNILNLNKYYPNIKINEYVIMPNHVHLILSLTYQSEKTTLGNTIATLKSKTVTDWQKYIKKQNLNALASIWQRNYFEQIIRNKRDYLNFVIYIRENPINWQNDPYHIIVK